MSRLDPLLVTVSIGTFLLMATPLARLLRLYAPTAVGDGKLILGVFGRPTWRWWAVAAGMEATHAAWHFGNAAPA
jgi:hypothetical protein